MRERDVASTVDGAASGDGCRRPNRRRRVGLHFRGFACSGFGGRGKRLQSRDRAGFVQKIDRAVGQSVVAQVPRRPAWPPLRARHRCSARRDDPRIGCAVRTRMLIVSAIDGSSTAIFCSRRASARSFSMCLNSSWVVEPITRSDPAVSSGFSIVARSIVPPVTAPAPDGRVHLVDEEDRLGPCGERGDDGLEALLEVAAEARAGEQRSGIEREHLRSGQCTLHVVIEQTGWRGLRPAPSCRRPDRRRRPGCSCGGGRGLRWCAAVRRSCR